MRTRLTVVAFVLVLAPSTSLAQMDLVVQAAQRLVVAAQTIDGPEASVREAARALGQAVAEWDAAIATVESSIRKELTGASSQRAYELHLQLGLVYRTRGRYADALREFEAAAALNGAASDLHLLRGLTFNEQHAGQRATEAFSQSWSLDPNNPIKAYYALRADGLVGADRERALALLREAYRRTATPTAAPQTMPFPLTNVLPDTVSGVPVVGTATTAHGYALLVAGKYSEGVASLTGPSPAPALSDSPRWHFDRAQQLEAEGHVSDARREYAAAVKGALAGRSIIYTAIGRLAQVEGDIPAALAAYREAVTLNPHDVTMRLELANAYVAHGSTDDAFVELMGGLLITPRNASLHAGIGQLRLDAGDPEGALPALTRALELNPDRYELRYALATALTRLGRADDAATQLREFERVRRELLERRRAAIQQDVEKEEAVRRRLQTESATP